MTRSIAKWWYGRKAISEIVTVKSDPELPTEDRRYLEFLADLVADRLNRPLKPLTIRVMPECSFHGARCFKEGPEHRSWELRDGEILVSRDLGSAAHAIASHLGEPESGVWIRTFDIMDSIKRRAS